jgi:hypothetical protein
MAYAGVLQVSAMLNLFCIANKFSCLDKNNILDISNKSHNRER